ncbi:hypothetical protein AX16_005913 [Volvariella volvacea WC 439]|nr:hypothetical protein AX16_005913 [Volvariella volvacea WC 439]
MLLTPVNPLHRPIYSSQLSKYSTLSNALYEVPRLHRFISPSRRWLPQADYVPLTKGTYDAIEHQVGSGLDQDITDTVVKNKSQPRFMTARQTRDIIWFDYAENGLQGQGVSVAELTTRSLGGVMGFIQGAEERVFSGGAPRFINVVIRWPGYEYLDGAGECPLDTQPEGPDSFMTRVQLGQKISLFVKDYYMASILTVITEKRLTNMLIDAESHVRKTD